MLNHQFWKNRKVLVTGHTGFKGSWLIVLLRKLGAEVYGYSLLPQTNPSLFNQISIDNNFFAPAYNCFEDINNLDQLKVFVKQIQPTVVFHLAAQPLVRMSYEDPLYTWQTNVNGSLHMLESLRTVKHNCAVVMITTDKVYQNKEWTFGYRENDRLGGHDPYSASKAAAEIAISSWRSSFCGGESLQTNYLRIATARAGNVIGGGDWAVDRIIPDAIRALSNNLAIPIRNPKATRPWQHVLEPLVGYMILAEALTNSYTKKLDTFNFGPTLDSNKSVESLVNTILDYWPGKWINSSCSNEPHEANLLHLQIDKSVSMLGWKPRWDFIETVARTVQWYKAVEEGADPLECCLVDINDYLCHLN